MDYTTEKPANAGEWEGQVGGESMDEDLMGMDPQPDSRPKLVSSLYNYK